MLPKTMHMLESNAVSELGGVGEKELYVSKKHLEEYRLSQGV